ncbi:U-scoloptoxin(19)-Sm1a [Nilaparvata lugens]|uniref:Seminal fluid protein n=1 Tax=Nilaparvata lugens TaxID=108931 RepID=A0A1I9WL85_NILLU|nr:U-scoloptoxin(19)-Sm1a [Nilaparvata lugens]APA33905.1 seminal fluid protein [Nilaparvata lugens]
MVYSKIDMIEMFGAVIILNLLTCSVAGIPSDKAQRLIENEMTQNEAEDMQDAYWNEMECLQEGGICLPADECPKGHEAANGLCPAQQENGIECCHGLSNKERACSRRGGLCRDKIKCPESLRIPYANDCQSQEICCALV